MWELTLTVLGIFGLVFGLTGLYRRSKKFRFHVKYFSFNCMMIFCAMYALVIGLFHPFDVENFHRAKDFVYNNLVRFYSVRAVVEGLDTFDTMKGKNFIIVANHQSSLDMFPLLKATPHRTTFLAKKELLFAPLFGVAAWLYGVVFINRAHSKSARGVMDQTAKRISEKKVRTVDGMIFVPYMCGMFRNKMCNQEVWVGGGGGGGTVECTHWMYLCLSQSCLQALW